MSIPVDVSRDSCGRLAPRRATGNARILRFLLPLLFPLGVASTAGSWGFHLTDAYWLSGLLALSMVLFLIPVRRISARTMMPAFVAMVLLIGYPLKALFLGKAMDRWDMEGLGPLSYVVRWVGVPSTDLLFRCYALATVGVSVFFFVSFLFLCSPITRPRIPAIGEGIRSRRLRRLVWCALLITLGVIVVTNITALQLGILRMGEEPRRLPFRLGGVIILGRAFAANNALLLLLYFALVARARRLAWAVVGGMAAANAFTAFVSASRAAAVFWVMPVLFLLIILGRVTLRRLLSFRMALVGIPLIVLALLTHPLMSFFREYTTVSGTASTEAMRIALMKVGEQVEEHPLQVIGLAATTLLARVSGAEHLLILGHLQPSHREARSRLVNGGEPLATYYTREVLEMDTYSFAITPGLFGEFTLYGGVTSVALGMTVFAVYLYLSFWIYAAWIPWVSAPVILAYFTTSAVNLAIDGRFLDTLRPEPLLYYLLGMVGTEVLARAMMRWSKSRVATPGGSGGAADPKRRGAQPESATSKACVIDRGDALPE